jgi:hypothetical protein
MSEEPFIIAPDPQPIDQVAAIICGHDVIQALGVDGMADFYRFVQEVLATTVGAPWIAPRCPRCGWRSSVYESLPPPPEERKD